MGLCRLPLVTIITFNLENLMRNLTILRQVNVSQVTSGNGVAKFVEVLKTSESTLVIELRAKVASLEKQIFAMKAEQERIISANAHFEIKASNHSMRMREAMKATLA